MWLLNNRKYYSAIIYIVTLAAVAFPQSKPKLGWVFGEVGIVTPGREETERFPFAKIIVERNAREFTFEANDGAIIDVQLPVGKYRLLRVMDRDGNQFEFLDYQNFFFKVKSKKRVLFNIHLKPLRIRQSIANSGNRQTNLESPAQADYCEIIRQPEKFVGQEVLISSRLIFGWSYPFFRPSDGCDDGVNVQGRFSVEYDPAYKSNSPPNAIKTFEKVRRSKKGLPVPAVDGDFAVSVRRYKKQNEFDTRFEYEIWIVRVERAKSAN